MKSEAFARYPDYRLSIEPAPGRIRGLLGGRAVVESDRALVVLETDHAAIYYFPRDDVAMGLLEPTPRRTHCPFKGDASYWNVRAGDRLAESAVWSYEEPYDQVAELKGLVAFYWDRLDGWSLDGRPLDAPARA